VLDRERREMRIGGEIPAGAEGHEQLAQQDQVSVGRMDDDDVGQAKPPVDDCEGVVDGQRRADDQLLRGQPSIVASVCDWLGAGGRAACVVARTPKAPCFEQKNAPGLSASPKLSDAGRLDWTGDPGAR
jgi:hypothetical protein